MRPFSSERVDSFPPQADHALVDLFSSAMAGGTLVDKAPPHLVPKQGLEPQPRVGQPSMVQTHAPQFPCSIPIPYQIYKEFLLEIEGKGKKAYITAPHIR